MVSSSDVRERMEVVGSDGGHVGVVDHVEASSVKLARTDAAARGQHHVIDLIDIDRVDGGRLWLRVTAHEAIHRMTPARQYAGD
jgi:hypothetical protein